MPKINKNIDEIPFVLTKKVSEGTAEEPKAVNLSRGQAGFLPPSRIYEEAKIIINKDDKTLFRYEKSAGAKELREAIANWYGRQFNLDLNPRDVAVTVGGTGAIDLALRVLTSPGDQIVVPDPSYPFYIVASKHGLGDREVERVPIGIEKLTREKLELIVRKNTQLVMLTSPHNPTGVVYDEQTLKGIVDLAREKDFFVVYDENHFPEVYDGRKHLPIHLFDDGNSIMLGSLSRLALQGDRIGWAVLPNSQKDLASKYTFLSPFTSTRSQKLATFVLNNYEELGFGEEFRRYEEKRNWFVPELNKLKGFECHTPEGTSYAFPNIRKFVDKNREMLGKTVLDESRKRELSEEEIDFSLRNNSALMYKFLLYYVGVGTVPGIAYGPHSDDYLRFTFSVEEKDLREATERMKTKLEAK